MKLNDDQILEAAIKKAMGNGYLSGDGYAEPWCVDDAHGEYGVYYHIIFSHEFAKAFWGEDKQTFLDCGHAGTSEYFAFEHQCPNWEGFGFSKTSTAWRYHLQQLVLEEEPLKYLARFLDKEASK